jgi:hypothetical protein
MTDGRSGMADSKSFTVMLTALSCDGLAATELHEQHYPNQEETNSTYRNTESALTGSLIGTVDVVRLSLVKPPPSLSNCCEKWDD